nr:MAG TPA: hypothetical protein [Caudoviricetes sp.]DAZ36006.1 MAG TPA: hypothetical protein [Caudoviricetes sp.]
MYIWRAVYILNTLQIYRIISIHQTKYGRKSI